MDFNKVISIEKDVYERWLMFINPLYNLSQREIDFLACLLKKYNQISESLTDDNYINVKYDYFEKIDPKVSPRERLINQILFSTETRKELQSSLKIKNNYFDVLLNKLRRHNVIKNNIIDKKIIPNFNQKGGKAFTLLVCFKNEK